VTIAGAKLWSDTGNKQRQVQWHNSDGDELECDEHCLCRTSGSDDGNVVLRLRGGKQRRELYGHGFLAEHHEFESDVRIGRTSVTIAGANFGATQEQAASSQWHNSDGDELECDEHNCACQRSDDGNVVVRLAEWQATA